MQKYGSLILDLHDVDGHHSKLDNKFAGNVSILETYWDAEQLNYTVKKMFHYEFQAKNRLGRGMDSTPRSL